MNTTTEILDNSPLAMAEIKELNRDIRQFNQRLLLNAIHQQTLAETAARSEVRLRSLIQGLNAIVCEIDAVSGTFTFVSERAESFLGYSIERWNKPGFWKHVIHKDDYEQVMNALRTEGPPGDDYQHSFRMTSADGAEIWLRSLVHIVRDPEGKIAMRRCVIVDSTDQQSTIAGLTLEVERNRAIAEAMQYSLLWPQPTKLFPGLNVAAFYEPAGSEALVGGDFFDAFRLPDQTLILVVGDVTGKGLKAAARTVEVKFALRAFAHDYKDPDKIMSRVNQFICDFHPDDDVSLDNRLIVLSLISVNPETGTIQVASGGAERPFIVRASGIVEEIAADGLILGIDRAYHYASTEGSLRIGDTLFIATDGLIEARRGSAFFGNERLVEVSRRASEMGTPQEIGTAVLEAAHAYCEGPLIDDMCLLVVRRVKM